MAYTPSTQFEIKGAYTPSTQFDLSNSVNAPAKKSIKTLFSIAGIVAKKDIKTTFNLTTLAKKSIKNIVSLNALVSNSITTQYSLTTRVKKSIKTAFNINQNTIASANVRTTFALLNDATSIILPIDAVMSVNGVEIDIITASISQDEDSWTWAFNATIADQANWTSIKPTNGNYPAITLTVRGITFSLMIEGARRSRRDVSNTWSISGRGITGRLDGKSAAGVETNWRNVNAKAIIQELCDDANIVLDYNDVDWQIKELDGQGRYPIEIINEIATAIGAVVQTSEAGTLIIRPRYVYKPTEYSELTPDFTISDDDDYRTLDEQWLDRDNYNTVSVGDSGVDTNDETALSITSEDQVNNFDIKIGDNKVVKIYSVPFIDEISLDDSSVGSLKLTYEGIMTKTVELEAVEIIEGSGSVSLPFYDLLSATFIYQSLGEITITESGNITTEIKGQSLINLSYTTKFHQYVAQRTSTDKYLQVFAEVEL